MTTPELPTEGPPAIVLQNNMRKTKVGVLVTELHSYVLEYVSLL